MYLLSIPVRFIWNGSQLCLSWVEIQKISLLFSQKCLLETLSFVDPLCNWQSKFSTCQTDLREEQGNTCPAPKTCNNEIRERDTDNYCNYKYQLEQCQGKPEKICQKQVCPACHSTPTYAITMRIHKPQRNLLKVVDNKFPYDHHTETFCGDIENGKGGYAIRTKK